VLIAGTAVIGSQIRYMKNQDLGYAKEQMLVLPVQGTDALSKRYETIKSAFLTRPGVKGAAASSGVPGQRMDNFNVSLVEAGKDHNWAMNHLFVDADFLSTYKIGVAAGRPFERDRPADETKDSSKPPVFMVNEAAVRAFGLSGAESALGKRIVTGYGGREGEIIGVVKDFHYAGLQSRVEPLVLEWNPSAFGRLSLNLAAAGIRQTVEAVRQEWERLFPGIPFRSFFVDEFFDRQYRADEQALGITRAFTALGMLISCLGLFGLASYLAEQRTKEIGVRKTLGASSLGLTVLFSSGFVRLVVLANLLAAPAAWYAMSRWLLRYAYRVRITPWLLVEAAVLSIGVAILSVGYQSIKAARTNPADTLRYE
jgi:putative ABC transport system permease protein